MASWEKIGLDKRRAFLEGPLLVLFLLHCLSVPALAQEFIRVLILDDQFNSMPRDGEKLKLMDKTEGKLLVADHPYTGEIEVWKGKDKLYLIDQVGLEDYVKSVVKSEAGKDWDIEALKAQAVASRTYALFRKLQNGQAKYDVVSSVLSQVFQGDVVDDKVAKAVEDTEGQILTYNGKPIEALYHSTSEGQTEDPVEVFGWSVPYLKPVKVKSDLSPYSIWARKFSVGEIEDALKSGGISINGIKDIRVRSHTVTGRVRELEITDENGSKTIVKATDLRKFMGWKRLPSTQFKLDFSDGIVSLEGSGYGHGVGLCQWSALEMAREGKNYKEILSYFYPGTQLVKYGSQLTEQWK
ncbi:MAG: SpoIID/LytB domain-containing protein [Nitrospiraceae bacterium]|nr:SpoIID/LytB domain-containing protein [Nitrospiraceae bacterium]